MSPPLAAQDSCLPLNSAIQREPCRLAFDAKRPVSVFANCPCGVSLARQLMSKMVFMFIKIWFVYLLALTPSQKAQTWFWCHVAEVVTDDLEVDPDDAVTVSTVILGVLDFYLVLAPLILLLFYAGQQWEYTYRERIYYRLLENGAHLDFDDLTFWDHYCTRSFLFFAFNGLLIFVFTGWTALTRETTSTLEECTAGNESVSIRLIECAHGASGLVHFLTEDGPVLALLIFLFNDFRATESIEARLVPLNEFAGSSAESQEEAAQLLSRLEYLDEKTVAAHFVHVGLTRGTLDYATVGRCGYTPESARALLIEKKKLRTNDTSMWWRSYTWASSIAKFADEDDQSADRTFSIWFYVVGGGIVLMEVVGLLSTSLPSLKYLSTLANLAGDDIRPECRNFTTFDFDD